MSEAADTFDVVVTGFDPGGEHPASRLQRVFGLDGPAAERLLARLPAPVQRGVPRIRAEYFRRALLKIGAHVEVRDKQGGAVELLPTVPPPAPLRRSERPSRAAAAPPVAAASVAPPPPASDRFELDEDDDVPLAASLKPEALEASPPVPLALDSAPPPAAPAALAQAGAIADTLFDARPRVSAPGHAAQPAWANAATALPAPAAATAPRDTLADASVRMPANPTLREGVPAVVPAAVAAASQWGSSSAGATLLQGAAVAPPPAAAVARPRPMPTAVAAPAAAVAPPPGPAQPAQAASLFGDLPVPVPAQAPGFKPPPLELGLDSGEMMSKLPSSIWDAPPPAFPHGGAPSPQAEGPLSVPKRGGGTLLDLPGGASAALDLNGAPRSTAAIDAPLDLPSLAPEKGRAPLGLPRPEPAAVPRAPAVGSAASDAPAKGPRARPNPSAKAQPAKRGGPAPPSERGGAAPPSEQRAVIDFWSSLQGAFAMPFTGTGVLWIGVIVLCALLNAVLTAGSMVFAPLGVLVALSGTTLLLSLSCDYFRACFWLANVHATALDRAPTLEPSRVLHSYLKSGAHVTVFALVTGLPLIFITIAGIAEGATPLDLFASPSTWVLGFLSASVWPGAVAMSALHNRFEAIWQLPRALAFLAKAPLEYLSVVLIGGLIFGVGAWLLLAVASAAGLTGALLSAALGLPMALGHGIQGALMGNLMRARPELFR